MKEVIDRRAFIRRLGTAALGLGFGVSVFDGIYQRALAKTEGSGQDLFTQGKVNFKGFQAKEITPNDEF